MAITSQEQDQVYEMLGMLGVEKSGDAPENLQADVQKGMDELEKLINRNDQEISGNILTLATPLRGMIDQIDLSDSYVQDDGQKMVAGANQLADVIAYLGEKSPDKQKENLQTSDLESVREYADKPQELINKLRNINSVVALIDKAAADGWKVDAAAPEGAVTGVESEVKGNDSPALDKNALERFEAQANFYVYKQELYATGDVDEQGYPISAAPEGQEIDRGFYSKHYQNMDQLVQHAQSLAKEIPGGDMALDWSLWHGKDLIKKAPEFPSDQGENPEEIKTWHENAVKYLTAFTTDKFQKNLEDGETVATGYMGTINRKNLPTAEQVQSLRDLRVQIETAIKADEDLASGLAGPKAAPVSPMAQQVVASSLIWRPGGAYSALGVEEPMIEEWKGVIGDKAPVGHLGADYEELNRAKFAEIIPSVRDRLQKFKDGYVKDLDTGKLLSDEMDPAKWPADKWDEHAAEFSKEVVRIYPSLEQKIFDAEQGLSGSDLIAFQNSVEGLAKDLNMISDVSAMNASFVAPEELGPAIQKAEEEALKPKADSENKDEIKAQSSDLGAAFGNDDQSNKTELSASAKVETVLRDVIAPLMQQKLKAANLDVKFEVDQSPDDEFGEDSQKALQQFLLGADKMLGDIGDDPWLYTEEKGAKLGANLKSYLQQNPSTIADMVNKQAKENGVKEEVLGVDKSGALIYAGESAGEKKGQKLSTEEQQAFLEEANKSIDDFILQLNTLKEEEKLSPIQLAQMSDMMPPQMQLLGFIIGLIAPMLPPSWMKGISEFCNKVFGIDLETLIPRNENGQHPIGQLFGVSGDRGANKDRLAELYKNALAEEGSTPQKIKQLVSDGVKSMYGGANAYDPAIEKAHTEAQKIIDDAQKLDKNSQAYATAMETASITFSAAFMEEKHKLTQEQTSTDVKAAPQVEGTSSYRQRFNQIFRDHKAARNEAMEQGDVFATPVVGRDMNGRISLYYLDEAQKDQIQATKERIQGFIKGIDNYDKDVSDARHEIVLLKEKLVERYGDGQNLGDEEKILYANEQAKIRRKEVFLEENHPIEHRQGMEKELNELLTKYEDMVGSQYKHVDVTDEIRKAKQYATTTIDQNGRTKLEAQRGDRVAAKNDFPNMYKIVQQSHAYGRYTNWNDIPSIVGFIDKRMNSGQFKQMAPPRDPPAHAPSHQTSDVSSSQTESVSIPEEEKTRKEKRQERRAQRKEDKKDKQSEEQKPSNGALKEEFQEKASGQGATPEPEEEEVDSKKAFKANSEEMSVDKTVSSQDAPKEELDPTLKGTGLGK